MTIYVTIAQANSVMVEAMRNDEILRDEIDRAAAILGEPWKAAIRPREAHIRKRFAMTEGAVEPTEMEIRVAEAILRASGFSEEHVKYWAPHWIAESRAAILAMREPTKDMRRASDDVFNQEPTIPPSASEYWRAMIDAALSKAP